MGGATLDEQAKKRHKKMKKTLEKPNMKRAIRKGKRTKSGRKPLRILWGSEQPTRPTGYATVTRELVKRLVKKGHEVFVMGWDYNGEPMKHEEGWTMVHAGIGGFGSETIAGAGSPTVLDMHLEQLKPDLYISLIDLWFIGHAVVSTNRTQTPYIAYLPIDGYPVSYAWKDILKMLHTPLWMSEFGRDIFSEFINDFSSDGNGDEGLKDPVLDRYIGGSGEVLLHGIDADVFKPMTDEQRKSAKEKLGLKWDFTLLHVGRNTNRKQIPRLINAFREFWIRNDKPFNVGMILHVGDPTDSTGMGGWNLPQLIKEAGLESQIAFSDTTTNPLFGLSREELAMLYGLADVHVLATGGEGFGVPSAEAMACGTPIILPDNSTGPELIGNDNERGWLVPCATNIVGPKWGVNLKLVDESALADTIQEAYDHPELVKSKGESAREWAVKNLTWDLLTDQLEELIHNVAETKHPLGDNSEMLL